MRGRSGMLVAYVAGVALLAAWVETQDPAPSTTVYRYETAAAVTVEATNGADEIVAAAVDNR